MMIRLLNITRKEKTMIKINNLSKSYDGKNKIVKNINLHIKSKDLYGFIGHNGAGKTTTLKALAGIHDFDGDILIDGISLKDNLISSKLKMAYIPDNPEIYETLTGIQYINLISDLYKVSKEQRKESINKYSIEFELTSELNNLISSYSHGMKQKLVIIASLVHKPKILLMDEPFVGLDPKASFTLKKIMQEFCNEGNCIIYSTHVLEVAQNLCNKIAIIKQGEIILDGITTELTEKQSLEEIFMEQNNE